MRIKLLSNRYAQALFNLAQEFKILDKVDADLKLVGKVMAENRELRVVMGNPIIDVHKKIKIINALFEGKLQELSIRFLRLITNKGREKYIQYICEAFDGIYKDYKNILPVNFTTAQNADISIIADITKKLKEATSMNIELTENINENIIGGFVVNFQDYKYDASVINQLNKLKKGFSENLYKIQF